MDSISPIYFGQVTKHAKMCLNATSLPYGVQRGSLLFHIITYQTAANKQKQLNQPSFDYYGDRSNKCYKKEE